MRRFWILAILGACSLGGLYWLREPDADESGASRVHSQVAPGVQVEDREAVVRSMAQFLESSAGRRLGVEVGEAKAKGETLQDWETFVASRGYAEAEASLKPYLDPTEVGTALRRAWLISQFGAPLDPTDSLQLGKAQTYLQEHPLEALEELAAGLGRLPADRDEDRNELFRMAEQLALGLRENVSDERAKEARRRIREILEQDLSVPGSVLAETVVTARPFRVLLNLQDSPDQEAELMQRLRERPDLPEDLAVLVRELTSSRAPASTPGGASSEQPGF